jgi:hypothetical protein
MNHQHGSSRIRIIKQLTKMNHSNKIERFGIGIVQFGNPELMSLKDRDTLRMYGIWKPTIKTSVAR